MKMITLEKLRDSLRDWKHVVTVEPEIAERARGAIERMVAITLVPPAIAATTLIVSPPSSFGFEAVALARVRPVDVDVHERAQLVALVEEQVAHRESAQRGADRRRLQLELFLPARLIGQQAGQEDGYCHSATSTDRIGGSCDAASIHSSPSFGETKTEPLWVPR